MDNIQYFADRVDFRVIPVTDVKPFERYGSTYYAGVKYYPDGHHLKESPLSWGIQTVDKDAVFDTEDDAYTHLEKRLLFGYNRAETALDSLRNKLDSVRNYRQLLKDSTTNEQD